MAATPDFFDNVPDEVYINIGQRAVETSREHEAVAPEGHYNPSQLDRTLSEINQRSRGIVRCIMARDYLFIEVRYHNCQYHNSQRQTHPIFRDMFQNACHRRVLSVRDHTEMETSHITLNIYCQVGCENKAGLMERLVFTEVTPFTSILICNMIPGIYRRRRRLGIEIAWCDKAAVHVKNRLRHFFVCLGRYLRDTELTYAGPEPGVFGLESEYIHTLTKTVRVAFPSFIRTVEAASRRAADQALLQLCHMREMHRLLSTGLSVTQLVPVTMWFHTAHSQNLMVRTEQQRLTGKIREGWELARQLHDNNRTLFIRGVAEHLLSQPVTTSHFALSDIYEGRLTRTIKLTRRAIEAHERYLTELQTPEGLIAANLSIEQVRDRFKLEELYKAMILLQLAIARMLVFSLWEIPRNSHAFLNTFTASDDTELTQRQPGDLLYTAGTEMNRIKELVINPLEERAGGPPYNLILNTNADANAHELLFDQAGVLTQAERRIYFDTRIWLRHAEHLSSVIHRASRKYYPDPALAEKALDLLRGPDLLYSIELWRTMSGEDQAPNEVYLSSPDLMAWASTSEETRSSRMTDADSDSDTLRRIMTSYTFPFYNNPKTMEEVYQTWLDTSDPAEYD